jgi:hypothetical protein
MFFFLRWQQNMLNVATETNEAAVQASFTVSHTIAKKSKPFTDDAYVEGVYNESSGNAVSRETTAF